MVILRAFLALAAGFASLMGLDLLLNSLLRKLTPEWVRGAASPGAGYALVQLGSSFLFAAVGGSVTVLAAASANPLILVLALALVVLLLAAHAAVQTKGERPLWLQLAMVAASPLGVLAGGLLWS